MTVTTTTSTAAAPRRRGLAGSAAVMFSGTFVSRILGLVRNMVLVAAIAATGGAADAFAVANTLPNTIYMLLAGGVLNAILVPQIVRAMKRADGGRDYVNRLLTVAGVGLFVLTVGLTAASAVLVTLYGSRLDAAWLPIAFAFALWCVPQLFFYGMYTLLGQVLNARSSFGPYMWAPAVNNVIAIAGLVVYLVMFGSTDPGSDASSWTSEQTLVLAGSATLGVAAQALVLVVPLWRSGFRWRPVWGFSGLGTASRVAMWAFGALAVGQLGYVAVSNVAAAASGAAGGAGGIAGNAAYQNAFLIFMLPQSLITVSLVTALFTRVADAASDKDTTAVRADMSLGIRTVGVFTVFATGALIALAVPVVGVITGGSAAPDEVDAIAHVLVAMLAGLSALGVWTVCQRIYYAFEDAKSLFWIQIPMAAIVIGGSVASAVLLEPVWWVAGAGAAMALSNIVGALVAYLGLRRRLPSLDGSRILITHLRLVMAAVPAAAVGWAVLHFVGVQAGLVGSLLRVAGVGALMTGIYWVLLRKLRVDELDVLTSRIRPLVAPVLRRLRTMAGVGMTRLGKGGTSVVASVDGVRRGTVLAERYVVTDPLPTEIEGVRRWRGRDQILQRDVEVATMHGPRTQEALDAARRAALVEDHRVARIVRVGMQDHEGYVVTEARAFRTLTELTWREPLDVGIARSLVGELASALEAARRRGVHHQVLRPGAVGITPDGTAHLSGLGFDAAAAGVRSRDPRLTARTDAVDLVRLLYFALTGRWPAPTRAHLNRSESFDVDRAGLPAADSVDDGTVPPGEVRAGVPSDLDALCVETLGPHEDGPNTPAELVRDLAPWGALELPTGGAGDTPGAFGGPDTPVWAPTTAGGPAADVAFTAIIRGEERRHPHDGSTAQRPATEPVPSTPVRGLPVGGAAAGADAPAWRATGAAAGAASGAAAGTAAGAAAAGAAAGAVAGATGAAGAAGAAAASTAAGAPGGVQVPEGRDEDALASGEPTIAAAADDGAAAASGGLPASTGAVGGATASAWQRVRAFFTKLDDVIPAAPPEPTTQAVQASRAPETRQLPPVVGPSSPSAAAPVSPPGSPPNALFAPPAPDDAGSAAPSPTPVAGTAPDQHAAFAPTWVVPVAAAAPDDAPEQPAEPEAEPGTPEPPSPSEADEPHAAPEPEAAPEPTAAESTSVIAAAAPLRVDHPGAEVRANVAPAPRHPPHRDPAEWTVPEAPAESETASFDAIVDRAAPEDDRAARHPTAETAGAGAAIGAAAAGAAEGIASAARSVADGATRVWTRVTTPKPAPSASAAAPARPQPSQGTAAPAHPERTSIRSAVQGKPTPPGRPLRAPAEPPRPPQTDDGEPHGLSRARFNPTPIVLAVVVVAIIVVLVLAVQSLVSAGNGESGEAPEPTTAPTQDAGAEPTGAPTGESEESPPAEEPGDTPPPAIASVSSLDPSADAGDNEDQAPLAVDGDPATSWNSLSYDNPTYGMKDGLGFAVVLEGPGQVSAVTLTVNGTGGRVEVRRTTAEVPSGGELLAEGSMSATTRLEFDEPTELDSLVLWFPELPESASDGRYRIELAEITLE